MARRVSSAQKAGVDTYLEARANSKTGRRDGALVDFHSNVARGATAAILAAAPALIDIADTANTSTYRANVRRTLSLYSLSPFSGFAASDDDDDYIDDDDDYLDDDCDDLDDRFRD